MKKKSPPKYLIIYRCQHCQQDSGYTEREKPRCRFCFKSDKLDIISKQSLTPEVISARLKSVADAMMDNLTKAYESLTSGQENLVNEGKDAEAEMLRLMERAKRFRDKLYKLELGKGDKEKGGPPDPP